MRNDPSLELRHLEHLEKPSVAELLAPAQPGIGIII